MVKNLPADAGDVGDEGSIPGLGRSPGGGHGNPLQYPRLGDPMDRGAWRATVLGVTDGLTRLSDSAAVGESANRPPRPTVSFVHEVLLKSTHALISMLSVAAPTPH